MKLIAVCPPNPSGVPFSGLADSRPPAVTHRFKETISQIVADLTGSAAGGIGGAAHAYYRHLPDLIGNTDFKSLFDSTQFARRLKSSPFSAQLFKQVFEAMSRWTESQPDLAQTFLAQTLPMLIAVSSPLRSENQTTPLTLGLKKLAQQVGQKKLKILSPLCPSYFYFMDEKRRLHHASGELIPRIGERFPRVAHTLGKIFFPLTQAGVAVEWQFWAYSGETGKTGHLVDLGHFVFEHYRQNLPDLFSTLQKAFHDLKTKSRTILGAYGIKAEPVSIDAEYGESICRLKNGFGRIFPHQLEEITDEQGVEDWLETIIGARHLIHFFIDEEQKYRRNIALFIPTHSEPLVLAALREALLYHALIAHVIRHDRVVIDTESSSNYMSGTLRHLSAPVIMGRAYVPLQPEGDLTLNIRQPYNTREILQTEP